MSYSLVSTEEHMQRFFARTYRTFRCGFCRALAVTVDSPTPPEKCGKCKR